MAPVSKWVVVMSVVGTSVGGLVYLKDYVGGRKYQGVEKLVGKTVIVTGANSGIGFETSRDLAKRGARVIMACRDVNQCQTARKTIVSDTKNKAVVCRVCDLASLNSIRDFATRIIKEEAAVHVLVNNAGVMRCPRTLTRDGFEMQLGVNHMGHFLLTNLLMDKLIASAPSRIVNVSSVAHIRGKIDFDDLNSEQSYDEAAAYNQSKLANVLFTTQLAKRIAGTGVTTYAVHPGIVDTNITRHMGFAKSIVASIIAKPLLWLFIKSPRQGAQTVIYCAVSKNVADQSGLYYSNCETQAPAEQALDESAAIRLWAVSETWTRLK